jgi:hypothetical protein
MPASVAAAFQDVLAVGGSHPHSEAVRLPSLAVVGLKSALHFLCLGLSG